MRRSTLPPLLILAFSAVIACSAAGTPLSGAPTESGTPSPAAPASAAQDAQEQIVTKICQQQEVDVSVNKCGDFFSAYPTGFVVDAATEIFDKNGEHIDSCGGNRFFTSDEARQEAERKCAAYLVGCVQVAESCRSRK
jgi:hypothetical protein